jgi:hypothetical protein
VTVAANLTGKQRDFLSQFELSTIICIMKHLLLKNTLSPLILVLITVLLFVVACQPAEPAAETSDPQIDSAQVGYPAADDSAETDPNSYPVEVEADNVDAYPGPPARVVDESKRFQFDEPIATGAQAVSGSGPPNVSITIISISRGGEAVGSAFINSDRQFEAQLTRPIEALEEIGILLGNPDEKDNYLDAAGATDIPMLGLVMARASSQP